MGGSSGAGFYVPGIFTGATGMTAEAKRGGSQVDIEEAGPVLMIIENPKTEEKVELTVESDDLSGDEDDMQLGLRMTKSGDQELAHWFSPKVLLHMKQEAGIWRFEEVGISAKAPIGDPDFLDAMAKSMKKTQEETRSMMPTFALQAVNSTEAENQKQHGIFSCSISELDNSSNQKMVASQAAMLKAYAYDLKLSGCTSVAYTAVAVPITKPGKAFCTDQTQTIRFASDGSAATCLSSGKPYGAQFGRDRPVRGPIGPAR